MKIKELDELKQLTDSLASVGLKSSLLIEKPMWLKMIDHQIKAVNIVNHTEHGKEKKHLSKKKEIGEAYSSICGKVLPVKQKDWVSAHYNLFVEVEKLLDNIIEKIS